ncbi:OmpH family outer membrane protein [Parasedimentitalea maritima]|uniref:OmpH family outer membrane protein n=2 Tax=Parasedimentitalea maritima TaxID=2578117 RepID=A0ABY2UUH3_9RHOB|nr:OmpH family outer membrane protein [Zongyanglinia marina]TLP64343.1 OmpH family outer membrane protein [Zongyanglinia marina]
MPGHGIHRPRRSLAAVLMVCGALLTPLHTRAQSPLQFPPNYTTQLGAPQSSILTIQSDRLFSESAYGRRVAQEIEADGAVLTAENRRIEAELRTEEQTLTERRQTMDPAVFRTLADSFDKKVQETRRLQEDKLREINLAGEAARREFFSVSLPILQQLMRETGAGAILEHSTVFLSADAADITDIAISHIDAVLGDGAVFGDVPEQ